METNPPIEVPPPKEVTPSPPPQIEQIEIIPQSNKHNNQPSTYTDKPRKPYASSKANYFDSRYNQSSSYHHNPYIAHFPSSNATHTHRTNSISYYRSANKKNSLELNRNSNYTGVLYSKKKKLELGEHSNIGKISLKGKNHNQLRFIHHYEKCNDFANYHSFLTLNLKFLKQNYKMKGTDEDSTMSSSNENMLHMSQSNNQNYWNMNQNQNQMNYMMNVMTPNNSNRMMSKTMSNSNMNQMGGMNMMLYNMLLQNYSMKMMMNNKNMHNQPQNGNFNNMTMLQYQYQLQKLMNSNNSQTTNTTTPQQNENSGDANIQNILSIWPTESFVKTYSPLSSFMKNKSMAANASLNIQNSLNQSNVMSFNSGNFQNEMSNDNNYRAYTTVTDEKTINENLKTGRYLTGVIRMNKCHTHGYITVPGLENDILIRGGRSLNQSINLDEVIVELFPISSWKPLVNKKNRKISYINEERENLPLPSATTVNINAEYNTDVEGDDVNKIVDANQNPQNEEIDGEYKETFTSKEERLKYINKVYNLRPEGRIVKILKSPNSEKDQISRIEMDKNLMFAFPIDETIPKIFIKTKKPRRNDYNTQKKNDLGDTQYKNKYYLVRITGWAMNYKCPKGTIVNEIGVCGNIEVESEVLLRQYDIDYTQEFNQNALDELQSKTSIVIDDIFIAKSNRIDLRNEIIFTVDPYTSKDLDDAISVKLVDKESGLLEIGVHIADPSSYVDKDSLLDKEAMHRATTVYLVQKNIPMLPRILSEDICSLMPNKNRLAITCTFRIYLKTGALDDTFKPRFDLSVINSKAKWNYDLVQDIIDGKDVKYSDLKEEDGTKPINEELFNKMVESVKLLHSLTKLVREQRFQSGSLMIKNDSIKFNLDEKTNLPIKFEIEEKTDSHHLIEELMLIANKLCAEFLYDNIKEYSLIRRHPYLNDNKFSEIQRYLISNKINVDYEDPQELNKMLMDLEKKNVNKFLCIQHKLKTFMLRAEYVLAHNYDFDELKHCALNFDLYTHFTSPIRRYPDLIVHRQIKDVLLYKKNEIQKENFKNDFSCYEKEMEHFNEKYNNSKQISQKSQRIFQCIYLKTMLTNKKFEGLVMDINGKNNKRIANTNEIVVALFVPQLNLELEWKKEDNDNILSIRFEKNENELSLDYKTAKGLGNKTIKTFDSVMLNLSFIDSIPIDVKCSFELE